MFSIAHTDERGFSEPWPAGRFYAMLLARHTGYRGGQRDDRGWSWRGPPSPASRIPSSAYGTIVMAKLCQPHRVLTLYLLDPTPEGITCRMLGEPWDDDALFSLIESLRPHPYAHLVSAALIEQADWLDAHPAYRGLPVKHRPHLSPDAVEIAP